MKLIKYQTTNENLVEFYMDKYAVPEEERAGDLEDLKRVYGNNLNSFLRKQLHQHLQLDYWVDYVVFFCYLRYRSPFKSWNDIFKSVLQEDWNSYAGQMLELDSLDKDVFMDQNWDVNKVLLSGRDEFHNRVSKLEESTDVSRVVWDNMNLGLQEPEIFYLHKFQEATKFMHEKDIVNEDSYYYVSRMLRKNDLVFIPYFLDYELGNTCEFNQRAVDVDSMSADWQTQSLKSYTIARNKFKDFQGGRITEGGVFLTDTVLDEKPDCVMSVAIQKLMAMQVTELINRQCDKKLSTSCRNVFKEKCKKLRIPKYKTVHTLTYGAFVTDTFMLLKFDCDTLLYNIVDKTLWCDHKLSPDQLRQRLEMRLI